MRRLKTRGNPVKPIMMDSRLRGNDKRNVGKEKGPRCHSQHNSCHPQPHLCHACAGGDPVNLMMLPNPWKTLARPSQLEPIDREWQTWLILAGRGFGKTRTGAETIWDWIASNRFSHIALVGQTLVEARQVMVEGHSGILSVVPKEALKRYSKSDGVLEFHNGAIVQLFGADRYERLRGPQFDAAWVDELGKFKHPEEFWEQLQLCLRLGETPKCIVTTTPRRNKVISMLINDPDCVVTQGSTFDNQANLAPGFLKNLSKQFAGTKLEAQEIYAQMMPETEGALWTPDKIVYEKPPSEDWRRIVVAVDPALTDDASSDETGIAVIGYHSNQQAYVLEDATIKAKPTEWVHHVVELYHKYKADRVIAEVNKGGDLVKDLLRARDPHISYKGVHATRGKALRAEPIVSLYEQGKVKHIKPHPLLEAQLCSWVPEVSSKSPDRLDALVWGLTELFLEKEAAFVPKVWMG